MSDDATGDRDHTSEKDASASRADRERALRAASFVKARREEEQSAQDAPSPEFEGVVPRAVAESEDIPFGRGEEATEADAAGDELRDASPATAFSASDETTDETADEAADETAIEETDDQIAAEPHDPEADIAALAEDGTSGFENGATFGSAPHDQAFEEADPSEAESGGDDYVGAFQFVGPADSDSGAYGEPVEDPASDDVFEDEARQEAEGAIEPASADQDPTEGELAAEDAADQAMTAEEARAAEAARLEAEAKERDRLEREARAREAAEAEERAAAEARALAEAEARELAEREAFIEENTLGSLLRGARATLGKHDIKIVEREIRIKAKYLHAIEALDTDNLPSEAYLPGYVRTYAAHLREALPLTPEEALAKFRQELAVKRGVPLQEDASESEEEISRRAAQSLSERVAPKISRAPIDKAKGAAGSNASGVSGDGAAQSAPRVAPGRQSPADALRARAEEARAASGGSGARGRRIASLDPMAKIERMGAEARAAAPKASVGRATTAASAEVTARRRKAAVEREAQRAAEVARASKKARAAVLRGVREDRGVDPIGPGVALLTAALVIGGLSYGVWSLLTDVQKVTSGEGRERTLTVVETLDPSTESGGVARLSASAYERGGALTGSGAAAGASNDALDGPIGGLAQGDVRDAVDQALQAAAKHWGGPEFAVHALEVSWLRVTDPKGEIVFAGRLDRGAVKALDLSKGPYSIRAGNAGGVALIVDGAVRGPLGERGRVRTVTVKDKASLKSFKELPKATAALANRKPATGAPQGAASPR